MKQFRHIALSLLVVGIALSLPLYAIDENTLANIGVKVEETADSKGKQIILILDFEDIQGDVTPLTKAITEDVISQLLKSEKCTIADRKNFDKMLEERELEMSGLIEGEDGEDTIGKMLKVDLMLSGSVVELEDETRLAIKISDAVSGELFLSETYKVTRETADEYYESIPDEEKVESEGSELFTADESKVEEDIPMPEPEGSVSTEPKRPAKKFVRDKRYYQEQERMLKLKEKDPKAYEAVVTTRRVLRQLNEHNKRHFFFVIGTYPGMQRMLRRGNRTVRDHYRNAFRELKKRDRKEYNRVRKLHKLMKKAEKHDKGLTIMLRRTLRMFKTRGVPGMKPDGRRPGNNRPGPGRKPPRRRPR